MLCKVTRSHQQLGPLIKQSVRREGGKRVCRGEATACDGLLFSTPTEVNVNAVNELFSEMVIEFPVDTPALLGVNQTCVAPWMVQLPRVLFTFLAEEVNRKSLPGYHWFLLLCFSINFLFPLPIN